MTSPANISPTAHYTGFIWAKNGLSHPELETVEGRVLFEAVRPAMVLSSALGSGTLEAYLMARHQAIDSLLTRAIDEDGITQVLEVAAGLSPRGLRFADRYGDRIAYIEADLDFHLALAEAAGNPLILSLLDSIVGLLREQRSRIFDVEGGPERGQYHHKRILAAVEQRDPEAARGAMREHLQQVLSDSSSPGKKALNPKPNA